MAFAIFKRQKVASSGKWDESLEGYHRNPEMWENWNKKKNFTEVSPDKISRPRAADTFTCCPVPLVRKISAEAQFPTYSAGLDPGLWRDCWVSPAWTGSETTWVWGQWCKCPLRGINTPIPQCFTAPISQEGILVSRRGMRHMLQNLVTPKASSINNPCVKL